MPKRLFTECELKIASKLATSRKLAYYAKRYAAQEAISKACETGIGKNIGWQDIEITNNSEGTPKVKLSKKAKSFLQKKFKRKTIDILLSLSDEKDYVIAFSVLKEKK